MKYTRTKQENAYYFRYEDKWYKTGCNLKAKILIVTEIDPFKNEYRTQLLNIKDKSNIYFYADFENLLIDYDTERWNDDVENGTLLDHHERNFYQKRYNLDKLDKDKKIAECVEGKKTNKFEAYREIIKQNPNLSKIALAELLGVARKTIYRWEEKNNLTN